MTSPANPPPPPPGPGVRPPFTAAPVEGRNVRLWLGLGIAGAVLAVCCGAGIVSLGGLVVVGVEAINEQAQRTVSDYLEAEIEGDWEAAYRQRCEQDRRRESLAEFTRRVSALPQIESYDLGEVDITGAEVRLSARVEYEDGRSERLLVPLDQDPETGLLQVCGLDR
jgi:hypothetical protein